MSTPPPRPHRNITPGIKDESRRTISNDNTGEVVTWRTYGYETEGKEANLLIVCKPGDGPPLHYHTSCMFLLLTNSHRSPSVFVRCRRLQNPQDIGLELGSKSDANLPGQVDAEKFEAVEGELGVLIGKDENSLKTICLMPGETAAVPIGTHHQFFNDGDEDITFKGFVIPAHAGFERSLYILYGLNNDGLADPKTCMPYSILHTALIREMSDMRFPGFKGGLMNYVGTLLATYARFKGMEDELLKRYWD